MCTEELKKNLFLIYDLPILHTYITRGFELKFLKRQAWSGHTHAAQVRGSQPSP